MVEVVDYRPVSAENTAKLVDLVGKTIVIKNYEIRQSSFGSGEYVRIHALVDGKEAVINTGAGAIREKLASNQGVFAEGKALRVKIVRRKSGRGVYYFDLDAPEV